MEPLYEELFETLKFSSSKRADYFATTCERFKLEFVRVDRKTITMSSDLVFPFRNGNASRTVLEYFEYVNTTPMLKEDHFKWLKKLIEPLFKINLLWIVIPVCLIVIAFGARYTLELKGDLQNTKTEIAQLQQAIDTLTDKLENAPEQPQTALERLFGAFKGIAPEGTQTALTAPENGPTDDAGVSIGDRISKLLKRDTPESEPVDNRNFLSKKVDETLLPFEKQINSLKYLLMGLIGLIIFGLILVIFIQVAKLAPLFALFKKG